MWFSLILNLRMELIQIDTRSLPSWRNSMWFSINLIIFATSIADTGHNFHEMHVNLLSALSRLVHQGLISAFHSFHTQHYPGPGHSMLSLMKSEYRISSSDTDLLHQCLWVIESDEEVFFTVFLIFLEPSLDKWQEIRNSWCVWLYKTLMPYLQDKSWQVYLLLSMKYICKKRDDLLLLTQPFVFLCT